MVNNKNNSFRRPGREAESTTMTIPKALYIFAGLSFSIVSHAAETVTIATVNNGDMIRMQRLS
jgi:hypothetical protein